MPRGRTQPPTPDLFSAATRGAFPGPACQGPSPKAAADKAADNSLDRYVLPKDLPRALKQLDDSELVSLLAAVFDEAKRRDKLRPGLNGKCTRRARSDSEGIAGERSTSQGPSGS